MNDALGVFLARPNACVFCKKIAIGEDEHGVVTYPQLPSHKGDVVRFKPLNPVTEGHMLFVPVEHIAHASDGNLAVARAVASAITYARDMNIESYNIIQSNGAPATQTVNHIHVHLVPRREGDGLRLPWTEQSSATPSNTQKGTR